MFSSFLILLTAFAVMLHVTFSLNETTVKNAVADCQNKVKEIQGTEERYVAAPRQPGEPVLTGTPFNDLLLIEYGIQQRQAVFECISHTLNENTDEDLKKYDSYRTLKETCMSESPIAPQCDPTYPYKSINGTCNNINHPTWGSTLDCFRRLFAANYEGVSGLRRSVNGKRQLPKPRTASLHLVKPISKPTRDYNTLFVLFGQAVTHDLAEFVPTSIEGNQALDCCRYAGTDEQYPECIPILPRPDDPFYSARNVSCLNVPRAAVCHSCSVDKRIQISQVTAYIDCSLVYSQTDDRAKSLRRFNGTGKMLTQDTKGGELLPPTNGLGSRCSRDEEGPKKQEQKCFRGGDTRTNQHAILAIFQTLLLREHNRLAEQLKILNSHWDDEKLYQESRKILIAQFQVIIYKEYLPLLIGKKLMTKYGLNIGGRSHYNSTLDPSLSIEFNAAAFRVHSLIPGKVVDHEDYEYLKVLYVNDIPLYNDRIEAYISKMSRRPGEKYDWFMPTDLTDWLYRVEYGTFGYDLAALDIIRGRDVGLQTYSQVIENMKNRTVRTFDDLKEYLVPECLRLLNETYDDVRDIDLWAGLNCERVPDDMIISPTAAEIIAEQFRRSKYGDRFFFEHDHTFTRAQRQTLLNASLAKLICDNSKVQFIRPNAMLFPSFINIPRYCRVIPGVKLNRWRERR